MAAGMRRGAGARRAAARALAPPVLALVLVLVLATACVTQTSISYLPSPDQPRFDLAQGQATLGQFVGLECERLREAGRAEGSARLRLVQDDSGLVTQADLEASSGDSRVDGVMGAIAAQLRLPPATAGRRAVVRAGYRCDERGTVTATLERL